MYAEFDLMCVFFPATLMVNAKVAKKVSVADQVTMLAKSGEGKEESTILRKKISCIQNIESTDHGNIPTDVSGITQTCESTDSLSLRSDKKHEKEVKKPKVEGRSEKDVDEKGDKQHGDDGAIKVVTPKSESSLTESQKHLDGIVKEKDKVTYTIKNNLFL